MNIFVPLNIAIQSLKSNRLRSVLTILGVVIGISSVIMVLSAGEAIKNFVNGEISAFGSNIIQAEIKVPSTDHQSTDNAMGLAMGISVTTMKDEDTEDIKKIENIENAYSGLMGQSLAVRGNENRTVTLFGVSASFIEIDSSEVEFGRFFTEEENKNQTPVVVLGYDVKQDLFGESDALERTIKLGRQNYRVIGVMKQRGAAMFFNWDDIVYLPLKTLQKKIMGVDYITYLLGTMKDPTRDLETKAEMESVLRANHNITDPKKDDFAVTTQAEMQDMLGAIMGGIQLLLIAIASISLIVGGVGIMNIMYVSVAERTFEIGLRKAVGATRKNVLWQFLWEAIFITLLGGLCGIIIGVVLSWLVSFLAMSQGYNFAFIVPWWLVALTTGFTILIGLVFGIYPARKASLLHPIDALRKK